MYRFAETVITTMVSEESGEVREADGFLVQVESCVNVFEETVRR